MTQAWDEELRARGYRVTPQRQLVLEAVAKLEHASPEEIWADVQQTASGVNISTIYRTLELLEQLGLVTCTWSALPAAASPRFPRTRSTPW
jgi:Fur family ferric uptake transcriptional regulator